MITLTLFDMFFVFSSIRWRSFVLFFLRGIGIGVCGGDYVFNDDEWEADAVHGPYRIFYDIFWGSYIINAYPEDSRM